MRRRLSAIFFVLAALAGSVTMGATPASAAGPNPVCGFEYEPGLVKIVCTIPQTTQPVVGTRWNIDFIYVSNYDNRTTIGFYCERDQDYKIDTLVQLQDGTILRGHADVHCPPRLLNVFAGCSSGGSRMQCSVTWQGGAGWISIRWVINGVLWTTYNDRYWLDIFCRAPSVMSIQVTVTDATGSGGYSAGNCSCHGGPLD